MNDMGYNGYFLIVQDFINWGKDRGVILAPVAVRLPVPSCRMRLGLQKLTR